MSIAPKTSEILARARNDLRIGLPIVIGNMIVVASENIEQTRLDQLQKMGSLCLVLTRWRAKTLNLALYDQDVVRIKLPTEINYKWVREISDPSMDLVNPIKGPLKQIRDSKAEKAKAAMRLIKETQLLPSIVICDLACGESYSKENNLTYIGVKKLTVEQSKISKLKPIVSADLPISVAVNCKMIIFRSDDGAAEHYAFKVGNPSRDKPALTRLHSTCFTGDVLGSLKCDCGPQLNGALEQIGDYGAGILLYLNQEGRGIGLANKIRAYSLQDQGYDTVEANHRLGFEDDERDYKIGAEILKHLGFSKVKLLTNNPQKVARLKENGISVMERLPLKIGKTAVNRKYLSTKARKSGHLLD
mgnify:CR=1 FL=1